jgi:hypothetical protein
MASDEAAEPVDPAPPGRPRIGKTRRVRITTTVEPSKLAQLRDHARQSQHSLGELADAYVRRHFEESTDSLP